MLFDQSEDMCSILTASASKLGLLDTSTNTYTWVVCQFSECRLYRQRLDLQNNFTGRGTIESL